MESNYNLELDPDNVVLSDDGLHAKLISLANVGPHYVQCAYGKSETSPADLTLTQYKNDPKFTARCLQIEFYCAAAAFWRRKCYNRDGLLWVATVMYRVMLTRSAYSYFPLPS